MGYHVDALYPPWDGERVLILGLNYKFILNGEVDADDSSGQSHLVLLLYNTSLHKSLYSHMLRTLDQPPQQAVQHSTLCEFGMVK